eukprot:3349515-Amphidinium_carterae.1
MGWTYCQDTFQSYAAAHPEVPFKKYCHQGNTEVCLGRSCVPCRPAELFELSKSKRRWGRDVKLLVDICVVSGLSRMPSIALWKRLLH